MTLAVGLTIINLIEYSKKKFGIKKICLLVLSILIMPLGMMFEGGPVVIPAVLISYLFRCNKKNQD